MVREGLRRSLQSHERRMRSEEGKHSPSELLFTSGNGIRADRMYKADGKYNSKGEYSLHVGGGLLNASGRDGMTDQYRFRECLEY